MLNRLRRILFDPRLRTLWAAASLVLAGLLMWLATLPSHRQPPTSGWDTVDHALAFTAFAFVLWFFFRPRPWRWLRVLSINLLFGSAIELAQLFVPSRKSEVMDVVVDMLGAALGLLLAAGVQRLLDRRRAPRSEG